MAVLHVTGQGALPEPRTGGAATTQGNEIIFSGGLSPAGTSTATVFAIRPQGSATQTTLLSDPVHDAAEAELGSAVVLFGGGQFEGSDRIIRVLPSPAMQIGRLPEALSDLDAAVVGNTAYVVGGYNGTSTSRAIYAARGGGAVTTVGQLPMGLRYPAAAALEDQVVIAGGETTAGTPTAAAWSFGTATHQVHRLPDLPAPHDHAPAVALNGRVYILGGLREGAFTNTILSWAPGEHGWRVAGHLPAPISDGAATTLGNEVVVLGGRGPSGTTATITYLTPR